MRVTKYMLETYRAGVVEIAVLEKYLDKLAEEFLISFVRNCPCALHVRQLAGSNAHHIIEGIFKSLARTLKKAVAIDSEFADEIPSTKGAL